MYKVYYNDRVILFGKVEKSLFTGKGIKVYAFPEESIATIWKRFSKNGKLKKIYISGNPVKILKGFIAEFNLIKAAGGLVKNKSGEYLMIFRNKKWDLPKGKLEKGENIRTCAKREVEEECGIEGVKIVSPWVVTYHIYELQGKLNIKQTKWFEMSYSGKKTTKPQKEEGIAKAIWAKKKDILKHSKNMYPMIAGILKDKKILKA